MGVLGYKLGSKFHCGKAGNPHRGGAFLITGGRNNLKYSTDAWSSMEPCPLCHKLSNIIQNNLSFARCPAPPWGRRSPLGGAVPLCRGGYRYGRW